MSYHPEAMRDVLGRLKERSVAEFRAVPTPGRRVGIQLERVFWEALTMLGDQAGIGRSEFIHLAFRKASENGIGVASALRCVVADALMEQVLRQNELRVADEVSALLQAAPMPSFVIDRTEAVVLFNSEFLQYSMLLLGQANRSLAPSDVELELETPPNLLFGLAPGSTVLTGVTVRIGSAQRRAMAKIVPVPPMPIARLVGYLTT